MRLSLRARLFRRMVSMFVAPADASLERRRRDMERAGRMPKPRGYTYGEAELGGIPAMRAQPKTGGSRLHLVVLHGGGYVVGSAHSHLGIAARLATILDATATTVEYRLAPEHPFPAGLDDCVTAIRAAVAEFGAENTVVVGDSAGGGATIASLCVLRDAGDTLPSCAYVMSPWTDLTASGETVTSKADDDPMLDAGLLEWFADAYVGDTPRSDPGVSPLFADLAGLPPLLVQVGSDEILLSDATRLVEAAAAAGVDVELDEWPGMWHVFQGFAGVMPEANEAMRRAASFIERHTTAVSGAAQ